MFTLFLMAQAAATPANPLVTALPAAVCMTRPFTDGTGEAHVFSIVVNSASQAALITKGFVVTPCVANKLKAAEYKARVCRMAAFGNEAVQNRFEKIIGAQPKALCKEATSLGSQLDLILAG